MVHSGREGVLSVPWVALHGSGRRSELLGVEAGDGGALGESATVVAGQHCAWTDGKHMKSAIGQCALTERAA